MSLPQLSVKLFSPKQGKLPSSDGPARQEYKHGPPENRFPFTPVILVGFFQTVQFFPQTFCLEPHEIAKKDFDHTMGVVNLKEKCY